MIAVKIIVEGRVQGVAYRYYTYKKASSLEVMGNVRNLKNGSVCIHVKGNSEKVGELINWCHSGSPAANVTGVKVLPINAYEVVDGPFHIVR